MILKLKNIKPNSKITLFNIAHCLKLKWTLSQGLLAEMGGTSERTINRCLAELEENGYIKRDTKLFNGKGKETSYTIIWDNITKYAKEYEWYDDKNSNTADLTPSNNEDIPTPQPIEEKPVEAIEIAIEEEIEINNDIDNNMGTLIGEFKELNSKTTTPNVEEEFDNFSDELNDLLDEYEGVIEQLTNMIASANITNDVDIISTAKMAEIRIKNIAKQLINEIDKNNFYKYINEKVEIKMEKHKAA